MQQEVGRPQLMFLSASDCHSCRSSTLDFEDGKSASVQVEITQDAIQKAERSMRQIDARWPDQLFRDSIPSSERKGRSELPTGPASGKAAFAKSSDTRTRDSSTKAISDLLE